MRISLGINILKRAYNEYQDLRNNLEVVKKDMCIVSDYHTEVTETITYLNEALESIQYEMTILSDYSED